MPDPPMISRAAFEHAPPRSFATLDPHGTPARRDAKARSSPPIQHKGIERPVRIGAHLDSAVLADQDRHDLHFVAAFPAFERRQGGIHQTLRLLDEFGHPVLIAIPAGDLIDNLCRDLLSGFSGGVILSLPVV